jgi:hypothetical protein
MRRMKPLLAAYFILLAAAPFEIWMPGVDM